MYKIKHNSLFILLILFVITIVYLFSGFFQFFIGIPNTLYTLIVTIIIYLIIAFDILIRKKLIINNSILVFIGLGLFIVISGIVNGSHLLKILLYLNFSYLPLSLIYLTEICKSRKLSIKKWVSYFFHFIVLIQLPIIIIQKYGYYFLISLSNANQDIAKVDFTFGSFPLKADHALGFFLILYLLNLFFKLRSGELRRFPYFMFIYIGVTIFVMESNLTKLIFILILTYYLSLWIFSKINIFGFSIIILIVFISYNLAMSSYAIRNHVYILTNSYNDEYVLKAVERGYAKRPHIVLYQLNHEKFKWVGNGPYDYYNILKGEFKNTIHFSQLIWFYNDLGLIGLIFGLLGFFMIIKNLNLNRESKWLIIGIMLLYLFMTNVLGDISMLLSLLIINKRLE